VSKALEFGNSTASSCGSVSMHSCVSVSMGMFHLNRRNSKYFFIHFVFFA
jgi:hypothetical protein